MNILTIAYTGEGTTDERFLGNIILRTFESVLIEANTMIDLYDPVYIKKDSGNNIQALINVAKKAQGFHVLCVHADADFETDNRAFSERINPAFTKILTSEDDLCKNLVPIVSIQMTESWLLADVETLIEEIGTKKSAPELMLPNKIQQIELLSDPKTVLNTAIKIALESSGRRSKNLRINDIYTPLSQKINLDILMLLPSFQKFRNYVENALIQLNYLKRSR